LKIRSVRDMAEGIAKLLALKATEEVQ
jgi:hypothetical protein